MARGLDRIWVRFSLYMVLTIFVTVGVLMASVFILTDLEYQRFYNTLPENVSRELDHLNQTDQNDSARAFEIYGQYRREDLWFGEKWSLILGLAICLPFGLIAGFWLSRVVTLPLESVAEAANRVSLGDFSVRAQPTRQRGEVADLVRNFNRMTDSLESLERERRATAAAISHELRTPLTVLRARLYAICDGVIPASEQEFRRLLDQVEYLGRLVNDVHTLSLADAGRLSLHKSDIDLITFSAQLLSTYAARISEHDVRLEFRTGIDPVRVHADPDRLNQIMSNLIENALRYAASGKWLEVAVRKEGKDAVLTVSDNGPGLPEDVREHLFERFHRHDHSRSRVTGGSGLGLAIVHTLVTQQGGTVSAEMPRQGGVTFKVTLPSI